MKAHTLGSLKLIFVLIFLVAGLSVSAVTLADSILVPFGFEAWSPTGSELAERNIGVATLTASVTTDKQDYHPGETVVITATGFWPNELVRFEVDHITSAADKGALMLELADHQGHDPWYIAADSSGNVSTSWLVQEDSLNHTLLLTADQAATEDHGAIHAETTFTDSSIGLYDQCSNDDGDGYATGDQGCRWTNGNLQRNNSTYMEGDATVQRLWLSGLVQGSSHTLTLKYGTTKGGKHAYDYLTTWDHSENWIIDADRCQDMDANGNSPGGGCTLWGSDTTFAIPEDPNPEFDNNLPNPVPQPANRFFTMRNGTITNATDPAVVSGTYAGDSETVITITFTVGSDADACPTNTNCSIALWFGAHIARTDQWASGGATTVPGSPYHVALDAIDGEAVGQRDNQMQAGAIVLPAAQLTIVKEAIPEDPASPNFEFDPSSNLNGNTNFFLDDDGAGGTEACTGGNCLEQRTFTALVAGTYSVAEINIPSGWDLTASSCSDGSPVNNIVLDSGENVICTFTNTKRGNIIVDKVTNPSGDTTSFAFDASGGSSPAYVDFNLTDAAAPNNQQLKPGNYSVSETVPSGWDLTSSPCTSSIGDTETIGALELDPGETITCTFTNTKRGNIIVDKVTNPSGDTTSFAFDAGGGTSPAYIDFNLTDAAAPNNQQLKPGAYSVAETVPSGWDLTSSPCSSSIGDTESVASLELDAGETITCTFTNTKRGNIIVDKVTNPSGDPTSFAFDAGGGTDPAYVDFNLTDAAAPNNQQLKPGTYSVSETVPSGWDLTSATCSDGSPIATISLQAGETITCTFTNTKRARILVDKVTVPAGSTQLFEFDPSYSGTNFMLDDDDPVNDSGGLVPGSYSVAEVNIPAGWNLTSSSCSDGSPVNNIVLSAGEVVTCTFTNTKQATVRVVKNTTGGNDTFSYDVGGTLNGSGTPPVPDPLNITTVAGTGQSSLFTFSNLPAAGQSLSFDELALAGWSFVSVNVTGDTGHSVVGDVATLDVDPGETIVVTYANSKPDMFITISPSAVNPVGQQHVFTVTVTQIPNGATAATTVDITRTVTPTPDTTNTTTCGAGVAFVGNVATCTVTINSSVAGVFTANASATAVVGGVSLTRATDGNAGPGGSGPATKRFVNAAIALSPLTDVNPVGANHVITATVTQNDGLAAGAPGGDGVTGFGPAPNGVTVSFSLSNSNGATASFVGGNTCMTAGGTGTCTVTINSPTAGVVTINATTTFSVSGVALTRATNGVNGPGGTGPASKRYVDARIGITPLVDTNPINEAHTFTALVEQNDGLAAGAPGGDAVSGFGPAPNGVLVDFDFVTNTIGAIFVGGIDTCMTAGGTGTCTVQINSSSPGTVVVSATTTFTVGGESLTRMTGTGGGNSANAQKTYVAGRIITRKVTDPAGDPQLFDFNASWDSGPAPDFQLSDGQQNDSGNLAPGNYSVAETVPSGWDLMSATCTGDDDGTSPATIVLDAGETVTCTFTNQKDAVIIVDKVTNPAGDGQLFSFDASWIASSPNFQLADATTPFNSGDLDPGNTYGVTEAAQAGWDLTSINCVSSLGDPADTDGLNLDLDAGETITCTFTNRKRGRIIVAKETVPDGSLQQFEFDTDYSANFFLADGGSNNSGLIVPGTYSVAEVNTPTGWVQTSATCDDGSSPGSIGLAPGETVTCTFTNKQLPTLIIRKVIQGDSQTFSFVIDGTPTDPPNTNIDVTPPADGEASSPSQIIQLGDYSVTETPIPDGWLLTDASCVSDQGGFVTSNEGLPVVTFTANYGDDVVCSFFDNQQGGATRTQGFWSTHTALTNAIWNGTALPPGTGTIDPVPVVGSEDEYLCQPPSTMPPSLGVPILATPAAGQNQVLGGFWASIPKLTTNQKRLGNDQARMQLLQQYFAAVLNVHAFGTPIGTTTLANARAAYCGSDVGAMNIQKSLLAAYNESGDTVEFTPGVNATAKTSRSQANVAFWNITFR